ncbi:MAG: GGDEF domain-containing protein [Aureliella sp.]
MIGEEPEKSNDAAVLNEPAADCFRQIVEEANSGVLILNRSNRVVYLNRSAERLTGFTSDEILGKNYLQLLVPGEEAEAESALLARLLDRSLNDSGPNQFTLEGERLCKGGKARWVEVVYSRLDGVDPQVAVVLRDLDARKKREQQLILQAATDELTQLANRREFQRKLEMLVASEKVGNALAIIDLDQFKQINDREGHAAGDDAMIRVAAKLREFSDGAICVGRLGGDEFGALLNRTSLQEATERFEKLCRAIASDTTGNKKPLTVSIGVAVASQSASSARELLTKADSMLYLAKSLGRNQVQVTEL